MPTELHMHLTENVMDAMELTRMVDQSKDAFLIAVDCGSAPMDVVCGKPLLFCLSGALLTLSDFFSSWAPSAHHALNGGFMRKIQVKRTGEPSRSKILLPSSAALQDWIRLAAPMHRISSYARSLRLHSKLFFPKGLPCIVPYIRERSAKSCKSISSPCSVDFSSFCSWS